MNHDGDQARQSQQEPALNGDRAAAPTGTAGAVAMEPVSVARSRVESLLLVSDDPVTPAELARVLNAAASSATASPAGLGASAGESAKTDASDENAPKNSAIVSEAEVREILTEIADEFDARGSGFELREVHDAWRLYTRRSNSEIVEANLLDGTQQKLSRAALETLAVIAYRQPCTRAQVAGIRGVNCDGVIRTLTLRGLIAETGEAGGAHLYSTTDLFLEQLGMDSLGDLPELAPLLPEVDDIDD